MKPYRKLYKILTYYNFHVRFGRDIKYYQINGARFIEIDYVSVRSSLENPEHIAPKIYKNIAHELGHFLVCPENRRRLPDYGIPVDGMYNDKWNIEDEKAVAVEGYMLYWLGIKNKFIFNSYGAKHKKLVMKWWKSEGEKLTKEFLAAPFKKKKREANI